MVLVELYVEVDVELLGRWCGFVVVDDDEEYVDVDVGFEVV